MNSEPQPMTRKMPRPIYRWKSFWLGLFVACFLTWAWWDSTRLLTRIGWDTGSGMTGVLRAAATTFVFKDLRGTTGSFQRMPNKWNRIDVKESFQIAKAPHAQVPDTLVFISFFGLWFVWLFWHWKREQRKLTT